MTEDEHKKTIKDALEKLRDNIEAVRDDCAETITPHLKALGVDLSSDWGLYESIEVLAQINADSFFECVGFNMVSLCEDIINCEEP